MEKKTILKSNGEIIEAPQENLYDSLSVEAIHSFYYYRFAPTFTFPGETHDYYELCYVVFGNIVIKTDVKDYVLKEKEYMICKPNVFHSMEPYKSEASFYSMSFSAKNVNDEITMKIATISTSELLLLELVAHDYTQNLRNDDYLTPKPMFNANANDYAFRQLIKNSLENLLILFTRKYLKAPSENLLQSDKENPLVTTVIKYLKEHYNENFHLPKLAEDLNYSAEHICRVFSSCTGDSVMKYLTKIRLHEAMKLFSENKKISISEVSLRVGFSDPYYFSRVFTKMVGMTPKAYIKYTQGTHLMNSLFVFTDIIP